MAHIAQSAGQADTAACALLYKAVLGLHEASALTWDCIDFENGVFVVDNRQGTD